MSQTIQQLIYSVPDVSCGHCRAAITAEVEKVAGRQRAWTSTSSKRVTRRRRAAR